MSFKRKIVVVTGAAGNVGRAVCRLLAEREARVAAVDTLDAPLREAVAALPHAGQHLAVSGVDLLDPASCTAFVERVLRELGPIDGALNTVGGFAMAALDAAGPELWDQMFGLNLKSALNLYRAVIPGMRAARRGSLVAIGAAAALRAPAQMGAYAASKGAVLRLTESFADELKADGIRVNAVLPGTIDTPQNRAAMPDADPALWVKPIEVAEAILFLLSDAASGVSGALLPVGGRS
ncbi:MAG: SDR family oxidoreductase [Acetobacteraceae bacterium]|nr:SDR family oxidoreductase [Acetobacteraceae bacterium]